VLAQRLGSTRKDAESPLAQAQSLDGYFFLAKTQRHHGCKRKVAGAEGGRVIFFSQRRKGTIGASAKFGRIIFFSQRRKGAGVLAQRMVI
jgi:hypothetical protein